MKSEKLLKEFVAYCESHPELRFWQALRNWCGWYAVLVDNAEGRQLDTFHWEENKKP